MSTVIPTTESIEMDVLEFLAEEVLTGNEDAAITAATPLFDGLLDSLGTLRLVVHLEETYDFTVADGELVPKNFDSARRIAQYILRKINE